MSHRPKPNKRFVPACRKGVPSNGCAYSQIKIRKIGDKKCSVFTAGSIFRSINRVMGVINEFGLR